MGVNGRFRLAGFLLRAHGDPRLVQTSIVNTYLPLYLYALKIASQALFWRPAGFPGLDQAPARRDWHSEGFGAPQNSQDPHLRRFQ